MTFTVDELSHIGILRKSGRYPWGSGKNPYQRSLNFQKIVGDLRKQGMSDSEIARALNATDAEMKLTSSDVRRGRALAKNIVTTEKIAQAERLAATGMGITAIGKEMGINESSVRSLLAPGVKARNEVLLATAEMLKAQIKEKGAIEIGAGISNHLGISEEKLKAAAAYLEDEGYEVGTVKAPIIGTNHQVRLKALYDPAQTSWSELARDPSKIKSITGEYFDADTSTWEQVKPPVNIDSKRVQVVYGEDGGGKADGVIYVRPGVPDISLGNNHYAQVRIAIDGTHYLKGMAVYRDDLPDGVDLQFNTPKSKADGKLAAMKKQADDPENPFGSVTRQLETVTADGKKVRSAMNLVNEEGDWHNWSANFSSQFLSKQDRKLAETQLGVTYDIKRSQFDEIMSLTNPVLKKKLLVEFAEEADSDAVHLKAASLPRTRAQVILPVPSMKDTEIYAPNFRDGEQVALVRHPHAGTFEIPVLTVNNRNRAARVALGTSPIDAVGINPKVAERLSGADFDGDSVLVIPNNPQSGRPNGPVRSTPALSALKDFDPKISYKLPDDAPQMTSRQKGREMGDISNLITDMQIKGATESEVARAAKHSMVVIDAEKHHLDYKQSAIDNGIAELKAKYQGGANRGASTIISRSTSDIRVDQRTDGFRIDPETGRKIYTLTEKTRETTRVPRTEIVDGREKVVGYNSRTVYRDAKGPYYLDKDTKEKVYGDFKVKTENIKETVKKGSTVDDAFDLTSGGRDGAFPVERIYANHANKLKALANEARKASVATTGSVYSPTAAKAYAPQVARLTAQLNEAAKNKPLERQAQVIAGAIVKAKRQAKPNMDADELRKVEARALRDARARTGADKKKIVIRDDDWEAIQAGAVSSSKMREIFNYADPDRIRELATPRKATVATGPVMARAKALLAAGYTQSEISEMLGVPASTLNSALARE